METGVYHVSLTDDQAAHGLPDHISFLRLSTEPDAIEVTLDEGEIMYW
jgi:hypothetical protein